MMSGHFRLRSELSGAIAKRLAKNQFSVTGSFFNQLVTDICIHFLANSTYSNTILICIINNTKMDLPMDTNSFKPRQLKMCHQI